MLIAKMMIKKDKIYRGVTWCFYHWCEYILNIITNDIYSILLFRVLLNLFKKDLGSRVYCLKM